MSTKNYKSPTCEVAFLSDIGEEDAEKMIGKTVASIDAFEHSFTITFTDGSSVMCNGNRWDGCALGVEYHDA